MTSEATFIAAIRQALANYDATTVPTLPANKRIGFMGDSHAADLAGPPTWQALLNLNGVDIINRGIPGARGFEVRNAYEQTQSGQIAQVIADAPVACFIFLGKNDVDAGRTSSDITVDTLAICAILKAHGIQPILVIDYFVASTYQGAALINSTLNGAMSATYQPCIDRGYTWLNLVQYVCSSSNFMLPENTDDGCHLNSVGKPKVVPGLLGALRGLNIIT